MKIGDPMMKSLLRPFPPVRDGARLLRAAGVTGVLELARLAVLPVRRLVDEDFTGESASLLFAGNALHADLTLDASGSGLFGWMLVSLGQQYGFPVPVGGAQKITDALVHRATQRGVEFACGQRVVRVAVRDGRAEGVTTHDGTHVSARTVLAACDVVGLMLDMLAGQELPHAYVQRLRRFQRAASTFKVDWALSSPVPWTDTAVRGAGTVHIAHSLDELTVTSGELAMRQVPAKPFLLIGQMTTSDPTRSPPGTESMWAYTHVPQDAVSDAGPDGLVGRWDQTETEVFARRIEDRIEELAPGFRKSIIGRHLTGPRDFECQDPNLVGGDISGGTAQLHQQLVFRPLTGFARAETPIKGLYLASASAHPGGAVHGACGANAARAALLHNPRTRLRARLDRSRFSSDRRQALEH